MKEIYRYSRQKLVQEGKIPLTVVETVEDLYVRMALDVIEEIEKNNKNSRRTVLILPVGPVEQYENIVALVNKRRISLKNVTIINMDEYMVNDHDYIAKNHILSFRGFMEREFYNRIDPVLAVPVENRIFPEPGREEKIWDKISELGGVDLCQGGFGINGHIAFNEPPEKAVDKLAFKDYLTRVLPVSRETIISNSVKIGGCYDLMPKWCITVGMKEILSSAKLRIYLNKNWQWGILRKVLFGPVTAEIPGSFLQEHPDALIIAASEVTEVINWSKE